MIDLLLEKEYSKITIENITQRANISRGTFYQHFLDKDDLAYSIGTETMQRFWEILSQGNLNKEDMLLKALLLIKKDYKHFKAISKAPHVQFKDKVQQLICDLINNNPVIREKIKRYTKISDEIVIRAFAASFETIISFWIDYDLSESPEKVVDNIIKIEQLYWK
ncbi:TetR/AcrR family transcriptional regulator [Lachnospiraceae bacterium oral taxon 096]|nr:TetR/AcrR family transcriptional regulator [Lachnospiraceae bacterium oral taxon 096]